MPVQCRSYLIGVLLTLCGCVSDSRYAYFLAPGQAGSPGAEQLLLMPLNFNVVLPGHLAQGAERLQGELERYLEQQDRKVVTLPLREAKALWRQVTSQMGDLRGPEGKIDSAKLLQAQSILAAGLTEDYAFDAVVVPTLQMRPVRMQGRYAIWDGVVREIQVVNRPIRLPSVSFGSLSATGLSLHVVIYARDGKRLFESYGGLEFPLRAEFTPRFRMVERDDLLSDREIMLEGTIIAFDPYLPSPTPTAGTPQ